MKRIQFNAILTSVGIAMIVCALLLTAYNVVDSMRAYKSASSALEQLYSANPAIKKQADIDHLYNEDSIMGIDGENIPDYVLNPAMDMPKITIDGQDYIGVLSIPSLEIELPVIESLDYEKLKIAPCRYSGSVYTENMVIAAHNYTRHFGRVNNVSIGDGVIFIDTDGNEFRYEVAEIEVLDAEAVKEMTESDYQMTLFTCNYAGNKRITIRCTVVE